MSATVPRSGLLFFSRECPETLSPGTGSTEHPFNYNEDIHPVDVGPGVDTSLQYDVNTYVYSAANKTMITNDATIDILADDEITTVDDIDTDVVDVVHTMATASVN